MLWPEMDAAFVTSGGQWWRPGGSPRRRSGHARWTAAEIAERLPVLGLPERMPLSVLAVELLPEPNGTFADPLGGDLGEVRILPAQQFAADSRGAGADRGLRKVAGAETAAQNAAIAVG